MKPAENHIPIPERENESDMKTIDITIKGTLYYADICSDKDKDLVDEWGFTAFDYVSLMLIEPDAIEVEGVVYEKNEGEYPWTLKYSNILDTVLIPGYDFPFHMWLIKRKETCIYKLLLEDNEEFDIKKLTLISTYEMHLFKDSGLYSTILYNGKQIEMVPAEDSNHICYPVEGHSAEYVIEKFDAVVDKTAPNYIKLPWPWLKENE